MISRGFTIKLSLLAMVAALGILGIGADADPVSGSIIQETKRGIIYPSGTLSINVSSAVVDLGKHRNAVKGFSASKGLGTVQVDDSRSSTAGGSGWVVTVTCSDFVSTNGSKIAATQAKYSVTTLYKNGSAIGKLVSGKEGYLSPAFKAVTATGVADPLSVTWSPILTLEVTAAADAGTYTATITHSVV